jgi:hypothetical protein
VAGTVDFDTLALSAYLDRLGLRKTWLSILKTNLLHRADLAYIFASSSFDGAVVLEKDLIEGLSIGEIGVLYEYSLAALDPTSRVENGVFFTPDDVAGFMASYATTFPEGTWLDPCAGLGNLTWHLVAAQEDPERFLLERVILSDTDDLALLIARTLLVASFQRAEPSLFHAIERNFVTLDFLSVASNERRGKSSLSLVPKHDFVIVNPPYRATSLDESFETGPSRDLYAYFLENIIKTSEGFISITPQSFTNAAKFASLRRLLLSRFSDLTIYCFDNIPGNIFRGIKFGSTNSNSAISIRVAIMVARPGQGVPRITSLLRWRTSERNRLLESVDEFAAPVPLTEDFFPKVSSIFADLYVEARGWQTLASLCATGKTAYPLYIPSSPRYFISATKTEMNRSSQHTIYFEDDLARDKAYIVINSSLMYWWWRVRDGGMNLSQETLKSLPVPGFDVSPSFVSMLHDSEAANRVHKQNAGAPRENVKHPLALIDVLNRHVCSEYASRLLLTHENSEFAQLDSTHAF